jgi:hypothetical protein
MKTTLKTIIMQYSLKTNISTIVLLSLSYSAIAQWTSTNGFAETANPNLNIRSEAISQIFVYNDSLIGCFGESYTGAVSSVAYYATLEKNNGSLNSSHLAPRIIPTSNAYNFANTTKVYPEIGIGFNQEIELGIFSGTPSFKFGCFRLGSSSYLWQSTDTNSIASKPRIINGDTLIWLLTYKNKSPKNYIKINLITGDTLLSLSYSNIAPPSKNPNKVFLPGFIGESQDSIFIEFLSVNHNSFDSIGVLLATKKIRVYSYSNLALLDSFDAGEVDILNQMIPVNGNEPNGKPYYTDEAYNLLPGNPNTALRSIHLTSWKRDTIKKLNFYSDYFIDSKNGRVFLSPIRAFRQFGFTLLWTDVYYTNPYDPDYDLKASRLMMFDQNYNLKYQIASTGFNNNHVIYDLTIDTDGAVYFKGQQNSTNEFFALGKIDLNGAHPWFKNFVNQQELALDRITNLYPNPSAGDLTLANYTLGFDYLTVTLFDIKGKFIESNIKPDFNGSFSLPERLINGMYYLKVQGGEQSIKTFKVLLNR